MPCWYYEKHELRETPSIKAGIDSATEARYRKEGARYIIDTGTKMGLRWDTCATGVVYFHRFYMFHSFRDFNRYLTAATCLFLAGKVEETPKKCKDIIKATRSVLTDQQFNPAAFGDDPREEVMIMERILLQTLKFDLQVEHPYSYVIKFAKHLRGDKNKIHSMVQMAWTFVNDGLCTMICLLWEPDVVSVALMYLASRLSKYEITDWEGKQPASRGKWWEALVPDVTLDILESICHQVLDLYSSAQKGGNNKEESPPPPPPPRAQPSTGSHKRSRPVTPEEASKQEQGGGPPAKHNHSDGTAPPHSKSTSPSQKSDKHRPPGGHNPPLPPNTNSGAPPSGAVSPSSRTALSQSAADAHNDGYQQSYQDPSGNHYSQFNPYVAPNMYSSSFLSQEGSQNIQNLIGGLGNHHQPPPSHPPGYKYQQNAYNNPPSSSSGQYQPPPPPSSYHQPPPPGNYQQAPPQPSSYSGQGAYNSGGQAAYSSQGGSREYRPPPPPGPPQPPFSSYSQGQSTNQHHPPAQGQNYMQQHAAYAHNYSQQQSSSHFPPPQGGQHYQQHGHPPAPPAGNYQNYPHGTYRPPRPHIPGLPPSRPGNPPGGLPTVRITGRPH